MSAIVPSLRALIRAELSALRTIELGTVTQVFTNEGGKGEVAVEVCVRLHGSALELQRVPCAIGRLGLSYAPRVDDVVAIAFVGGDLNAPIAFGALYDERVLAPDAKPDEIVYKVPDDEKDGVRRFELQLPGSRTLTVEDKKISIAMGSTTITIEAGGDVSVKANGDLKLEATGTASLKGQSVQLEGQSDAKLKGSMVTIAGTTDFSAS